MTDVWSNVSWQTKPPTVHGETMMHGTRMPRPMGALTLLTVMYSSTVPGGAVGGATWSKNPSFSS